ncbi:DUF881 domain-containing protein [Geodermatophilus obscurus]|uniref:Division initiation protein n=1 Tax=Geodermatophilus obscurus (strain ATCC 25078 / DSM 43160 / JCM 3152 / CCUG 61914 / KCC A-0152 / KCTC 9177 / NBRC 13315 / NRRL B-3577 / G-20) TaxID=526225 RepID=D2S6I7_GEOOG|nr:DUF881 domain-containing protein [Geodermatophilus obscurus]ADB75361.1 protein of unknown function DUF881 [Geodermatophilus obscurus DSM 43160]
MNGPRRPAPGPGERPEDDVHPGDDAPDLDAPDLDAPDLDAPDLDAPDLDAPDPDAPGPVADADPPAAEQPPPEAPAPRRRRRDPLAAALIGVLTLLLGFAFAVQVRTTGTGEDYSTLREEDLVRILDELDAREDRLREQLADQRAALRELNSSDSQSEAALQEARERAEALGILNGTVAAQGPGLLMTVRDPEGRVRVADLLDAVQELRGAGAETMQIDGVRVGVSTAVTGEPGQLRIDGTAVQSPYEIRVIGSPQDLETAMNIPGGVVDRVGRQGGSVDIEQSPTVLVDALRQLDRPQYAQPDTDDGN